MGQHTVSASEFKAKCLAMLDDVAETGAELVITKRGKPVARLVPLEATRDAAESMRGSVVFHVDDDELIAPIDIEWDAMK